MTIKIKGRYSTALALILAAASTGAKAQQTSGQATSAADAPAPQSNTPSNTAAQSPAAPDAGLPEITVTANRRSERLQDVPIAVSQVSGTTLANAGITDVTEIKVAVPGTTVRQSAGYALPYIRGVGSAAKTPLDEPPVGTYVDDVYIASQNNILTFNNIQSVEVDKGPQGTLFGRNSTGGIISVKTLDPSSVLTGSVHAGYGNYSTFNGDAYLSGPISDKISADIAIVGSHQGDGFGRDVTTGKDVYQADRNIAVRSKILIRPDDADRIMLIADYSSQRSSISSPATLTPGSRLTTGAIVQPISDNPYDVANDVQPVIDSHSGGISLSETHEFGSDISLKSISAYRQGRDHYYLDADGTAANSFGVNGTIDDHQFTQELQLLSTGSGPFTWTTGVFYFHGFSSYDPLTLNFGSVKSRYAERFDSNSIAGYAQGSYEIAPDTKLTLGARYTYEVRHLDGTITTILPSGASSLAAPGDAHLRVSTNKPSFRASLDHKLAQNVMVYVSFNQSFKSGGYSAINQPAYLPETLRAYEGGVKSQLFDRHVTLNMAGFYYDYRNIQVQEITNAATIVANGGKARIYGLDADLDIKLTSQFSLVSGLEYLDAKYLRFQDAPLGTPMGGGGVVAGSAAGKFLPFAPKLSANVGLTHSVALAGGTLTSNAILYYSSRYFAQPDNFQGQRKFATLNASIMWESAAGLSFKVWGNNLTNKLIMENATDSAPSGDQLITYEPPRTYGFTIGYHF